MQSTKSVNYSDLFQFTDPLADRPLRLEPQQDWVTAETAWKLVTGQWQPPEPVVLKAYMGGALAADILWSGLVAIFCVSTRVLDLLEANGFTGWSTYPVQVHGRRGEPLPGYHGFAVRSWAGDMDISRSSIAEKAPHFPGGPTWRVYRGIFFDESKWDGSDFFRVGVKFDYTIVVGRVRQAFKRAKITNVRFVPLLQHEQNVVDWKIVGIHDPRLDGQ